MPCPLTVKEMPCAKTVKEMPCAKIVKEMPCAKTATIVLQIQGDPSLQKLVITRLSYFGVKTHYFDFWLSLGPAYLLS